MYFGPHAASEFFATPLPLVALCGPFQALDPVIRENIPNPRAFTFISVDLQV
jgi:hypothetical protein